jgi:hypothetical protein
MATHLQIQELANSLRIRARQNLPHWERLLVAGVAAAVVGMASSNLLGGWWWTILSVLAAAVTYSAVRSTSAVLQVTNVEFISNGNLGRRVQTPRTVCTGDVRRLEFQGKGSPLNPRPDGLYALTDRKELCLLPFLDWEQTHRVIHAIEIKFSGLAEGWRAIS